MTAAITFSCKNDTGSHTYYLVLIKSRFRSQNLKVSCNRSNFDFKLNSGEWVAEKGLVLKCD